MKSAPPRDEPHSVERAQVQPHLACNHVVPQCQLVLAVLESIVCARQVRQVWAPREARKRGCGIGAVHRHVLAGDAQDCCLVHCQGVVRL